MKKRIVLMVCLVTLFIAASTAAVLAQDKVDLTGTWELEVKADSGQTGSPIFVLKQEGDKLSGTYKGYFGEAPVTGTVKGNTFEMTYTMQGRKTIYKGKVEGNKMSGDIDWAGEEKGKFNGVKK